ncbi:MAG: hypothetical protein Greene041619_28 [Candidatus Peregrinibacteria bacterium Greene0416_19]|nr:MAG: hypothetical protein Greene041619_28 [Candidatus Peregrinibacteria bacterium Greene0416_19]
MVNFTLIDKFSSPDTTLPPPAIATELFNSIRQFTEETLPVYSKTPDRVRTAEGVQRITSCLGALESVCVVLGAGDDEYLSREMTRIRSGLTAMLTGD